MLKKIRMRESIGSSEGWVYACGQVVEIDAALAAKWVASGVAAYVTDPQPESAVMSQSEKAVSPAAKPKKRR